MTAAEEVRLIPVFLSSGDILAFALVDECDAGVAAAYRWHSRGGRYAVREERGRPVYMHHVVLGAKFVDHINGDTFDNRRSNLRPATPAQNAQNKRVHKNSTTGCRGVDWYAPMRSYRARVTVGGKVVYCHYFDTLAEADGAVRKARAVLMPYSSEGKGV